MNRRIKKGGIFDIMNEENERIKLFIRGDFSKNITKAQYDQLWQDLAPLQDKYEFHVAVETVI